MFSLISGLPSSPSAGGFPLLFERFIGTVPLSDSSKTCTRAVWLLPSPAGLSRRRASGISEVSRFSCVEFPDVHGVCDYAGPPSSSRCRC